MNPIEFDPAASAELLEAGRYYQMQRTGLGRRFEAAVDDAAKRIASNPLLYPIVEGNVRQCRVLRFPYCVVYRPGRTGIEVLAVMHFSREPGYWKSRIGQQANSE